MVWGITFSQDFCPLLKDTASYKNPILSNSGTLVSSSLGKTYNLVPEFALVSENVREMFENKEKKRFQSLTVKISETIISPFPGDTGGRCSAETLWASTNEIEIGPKGCGAAQGAGWFGSLGGF